MKEITLERIWNRYGNKYQFLIKASVETRSLIESISEGRIETVDNPYSLGLVKTISKGAEEETQ